MFLNFIEADCSVADFVLKGDDDILLNPKIISKIILNNGVNNSTSSNCPFLWGCKKYDEPIRNPASKYYIPELIWPEEAGKYPPYFSGACYLLSGSVAIAMAKVQKSVSIFPLDDVYIGILLEKLNLTRCMSTGTYFYQNYLKYSKLL